MSSVWVAGEEDADVVAALVLAFRDWMERDEPGDKDVLPGVRRLLADPAAEFLLASEQPGGEALGFCQLRYRFLVWVNGEECNLEDLFVREQARRSGLGRALVGATVERARTRGCRRIYLDANEANPGAIALYESFGFSAWADSAQGRNLNLRLAL